MMNLINDGMRNPTADAVWGYLIKTAGQRQDSSELIRMGYTAATLSGYVIII